MLARNCLYLRHTKLHFRSFSANIPPHSPTPPSTPTPIVPITAKPQLSAAELATKRQKDKTMNILMRIGCVVVLIASGRYYYSAIFDAPEGHEKAARTDVVPAAAGDEYIPMPIQLIQARRNPVVYLDVSIDDQPAGRIYIRLRGDVAPVTAENFLYMCQNNENNTSNNSSDVNKLRTLENTGFHRAVSGAFIQGGLLHSPSQPLPEYKVGENFNLKPDGPYWVGMAESISSPDPNHSQFFITTNATPTLEGKHVIFGRVIEGYSVIHAIENRFIMAGGGSTAIRITRAAEVDTEARMEFIRGSLSPVVSSNSAPDLRNFIPKPPSIPGTITEAPASNSSIVVR